MEVKLDHFPRVRGEHIKCLKPPPRQQRREHEVPQSGGLKMSMFFFWTSKQKTKASKTDRNKLTKKTKTMGLRFRNSFDI